MRPVRADPGEDVADELGAFRARVSRALGEEDLAAQTLVLAPLVEEHGPMRVAAALSAMARRKPPAGAAPAAADAAPAPAPRAQASVGSAPAPASVPAFTRIFISVGRKDGAGPGDIVGAIAGETGVAGDRIGRVELAETHTIAEIASDDARRVIDALNGTTIRGRSVRVDFDRPRRGRPERRMRGPGTR
jgi:ATP-dependent RNA helicase DeaD